MEVVIVHYAMACFLWSAWHARYLQKLLLILDMVSGAMLGRSMEAILAQGYALPRFLIAPRTTTVVAMYSLTSQNRPFKCMHIILLTLP